MKNTGKKLIIQMDDEHEAEITVREVLRLIEEGYTSGYYPTFYFETEEETKKESSNLLDELNELEIYNCPECECPPDDDWEYADFSNKKITICIRCGTIIDLTYERNERECTIETEATSPR